MYGVRGVVLKSIKTYLANRYEYVCVNDTISSKMKIRYGVPQGFILGSTLFLVCTINITDTLGCLEMTIYADYTNVFFQV